MREEYRYFLEYTNILSYLNNFTIHVRVYLSSVIVFWKRPGQLSSATNQQNFYIYIKYLLQ
jgi:hypothetical protein